MKITKKKLYIGSIVTLIVITAAGVTFYSMQQNDVDEKENQPQVVPVKQLLGENQENTNYLPGEIVPNQITKINIDNTKGTVSQVHVKVGDRVEKGQGLFSYSNLDGEVSLTDSQTEVMKAQNKVNSLSQTIATKKEQLNKKNNELVAINVEQEKKRLKEEINGLQSEIDTANNELNDANLDVEQATKKQNILQEKQKQADIVSDGDGIVQKIDHAQINTSGSNGEQSETFMEIVDTSSLKVKGNADELEKEKISVNQPVKIIDRKNQGKSWNGKISKLSTIPSEQKEDSTISKYPFEVTVDKNEGLPNIGSHVYIQPIKPNTTEQAIPSSFIFKEKGKSFVLKVQDEKAVKQEVSIGKTDEKTGKTEIKSGITDNDQLIVPTSKITEGMQVGNT